MPLTDEQVTASAGPDPRLAFAPTLPAPQTGAVATGLAPGEYLGRYRIVSRLGAGGMGVVYRAEDPELARPVAMKVLRDELHLEVAGRERLLREARSMAQLKHPNVVTVHDVGRAGDRTFIAMELVDGGTLRSWLTTRRSWRAVHAAMLGAARGLAAAHACGIVHRDFKPENVLIDAQGTPRVSDFGLARREGAATGSATALGTSDDATTTHPGEALGTPAYMAPEARRGDALDARADQYSLCVTWLEALTGQRPRADGTLPVKAPAPAAIVRALRRGLAADPAARWPSVEAMLAALAAAERRRRRWFAGLGAALLVGAAALAVVRAGPDPAGPIEPSVRAAAAARLVARKKPGDRDWKLTVTPDGVTAIYSDVDRYRAWLEDLASGRTTELTLPVGRTISSDFGQFRGSLGGHVVIALLTSADGRDELWRLGRADTGPVLLRAAGPPLVAAISADGRLVATVDDTHARLLDAASGAILGERLVGEGDVVDLAWSATGELAVLRVAENRVQIDVGRPGASLATVTASALRGVPRQVTWLDEAHVVVAHTVAVPERTFLTPIRLRDPAVPLAALATIDAAKVFNLERTARGLFVQTIGYLRSIEVGELRDGRLIDLAPVGTFAGDDAGLVGWIDATTTLFARRRDGESRATRYSLDGTVRVASTPTYDWPAAMIGDEIVVMRQAVAAATSASRGAPADQPGCGIWAIGPDGDRPVRAQPCEVAHGAMLRCAGARPPCVLLTSTATGYVATWYDVAAARPGAQLFSLASFDAPELAVAPDGERIAVLAADDAIVLYDRTGAVVARIASGEGRPLTSVGWMGADLVITTLGWPATIAALDRAGRRTVLWRSDAKVYSTPRVSPDGRHLAVEARALDVAYWLYDVPAGPPGSRE